MLGTVTRFYEKAGYGFVTDEKGTDRFFHIGNVEGEVIPRTNDTVSFEPYASPKGPAATALRVISGTNGDAHLIKEITKWRMEAKLEDNSRYFYHINEVDAIEDGSHCYVVGRKGTGKTAICEYLIRTKQPKRFTKKLTFKNFPFNELYHLSNESYTYPNQYITFWKYLIYSTVAQLMLGNENIDNDLRAKLARIYNDSLEDTLQRNISKITSRNFEVSILGMGGKLGSGREDVPNTSSWVDRVEVLEKMLKANIDDSVYMIVFDELDEDYKNSTGIGMSEEYTSLITSLFKAVLDIKSTFEPEQYQIYPSIFLRDDIYTQIRDPDRNKWGDLMIEIDWETSRMKELLAFRLSKALDPDGEILPFDEVWAKVFRSTPMRHEHGLDYSPFAYITRNTQSRPRDFIRFIRDCAREAVASGVSIIDAPLIRKAENKYSMYLKTELEDEIAGVLPEIKDIFKVLLVLGKPTFRAAQFEEKYMMAVKEQNLPERNYKTVLEILFNFSVVGTQTKGGKHVFRYLGKDVQCNTEATFSIHRGLLRALQLV